MATVIVKNNRDDTISGNITIASGAYVLAAPVVTAAKYNVTASGSVTIQNAQFQPVITSGIVHTLSGMTHRIAIHNYSGALVAYMPAYAGA